MSGLSVPESPRRRGGAPRPAARCQHLFPPPFCYERVVRHISPLYPISLSCYTVSLMVWRERMSCGPEFELLDPSFMADDSNAVLVEGAFKAFQPLVDIDNGYVHRAYAPVDLMHLDFQLS